MRSMSWQRRSTHRFFLVAPILGVLLPVAALEAAAADWPQWGGPSRNFTVPPRGLAVGWSDSGPRQLWRRPLGEGHSTIVSVGGRLYTMYRPLPEPGSGRGGHVKEERVIALDAETGRTLWEHAYHAEPLNFRFGAGPHSTPLVLEGRVFASSTNKVLMALDAETGAVLWSHDLVAEFGAPPTLVRPAVKAGYAPSPLAFGDSVIVPVGGEGQALVAFRRSDGSVLWKAGDYLISPSSPILIDLDGREQLVHFAGQAIYGLDPSDGHELWMHEHDTSGDMNNSTPVWSPSEGLLLVASAYDVGARMFRLTSDPERAASEPLRVEELWFQPKFQVMFGNVVRLGDLLIGSSGNFGPAFVMAVNANSGRIVWQERGFGKASFILAGEELLLLDEDGVLALAEPSSEGLGVKARAQLLETTAWSAPTLVGTRLYLRDRQELLALELAP